MVICFLGYACKPTPQNYCVCVGLTRDMGVLQACRHLPLIHLQLQGIHLINVTRDPREHRAHLSLEELILS